MNNQDVHVSFVLDQSGSMGLVRDETITGFNGFVEEQAALPGAAHMTLTLFDTQVQRRLDAITMAAVPKMARSGVNSYSPGGGTALYDAVIEAIRAMDAWVGANPSFAGHIIVAIWTDGGENSSVLVALDDLNDAIRDRKAKGWEFVFLGSGSAAWTEGRNLAVDPGMSLHYAPGPTAHAGAYQSFTRSLTDTRTTGVSLDSALVTNTAHLQADPKSKDATYKQ